MPDADRLQRDLDNARRELKAANVELRRLRRALMIRQLAQPELQAWMSNAAFLTRLITLSRGPEEPKAPHAPRPVLTLREGEVLAALVDGDSIPVIAAHLFMARTTVKVHVAGIYRKLGVHNRAGLVLAAVRHGFVQTDSDAEESDEPDPG